MPALFALAILSYVREARTEQKTALLVHRPQGAEDCPDAEELAKQVHAIVGREVIGPGPGHDAAWIEVTMTRLQTGYYASVHTFGSNVGRREISDAGPDCSGLAEAVAVSLALMWSSHEAGGSKTRASAEVEEEPPPPADSGARGDAKPEADATPEPAPRKAVPNPPRPDPRSPRVAEGHSWGVEGVLGGAVGVLQHPAPGAEIGARLGIGSRLAFSAGGGAVGVDRMQTEQGEIELGLAYGYISACLGLSRAMPRFAFCLRPMLGSLMGRGRGFDRSYSEAILYSALSAALELRGRLSDAFAYSGRVVALAPLSRGGFSVADPGGVETAFTTSSLGVLALIGVSWNQVND